MDKIGILKAGNSPCEVCGQPSVLVKNGQAVCVLHNVDNHHDFTLPQSANKVASVLNQSDSDDR